MLFTRRDLVKIILPLFAEQLLAVTIGMCDSMMVSSAGEAAVSGVSLVDTINLLLSYVFSALATGGAVICSQFMGREDYSAARSSARQLIYSIFAAAFAITVLAVGFRSPILRLVFGRIDADVMTNAKIYFLFTALSYPFLALYNGGAALFRSMGNSRISMIASIIMNGINVAGNALLIFIFKMGAAGAAIATLFSRIAGSAIMMILLRNKNNPIYLEKIFPVKPKFHIIKNILSIGIPNGMENGMFQFGKLLTQSLISTFGTVAIAANAVAHTMSNFEYAVGGAISLSMITIVGRCVGAGEKKQAKQYTLKLMGIEYIAIITTALLLTVLAKPIIGVYNLSGESSRMAFELIIFHNICVSTIWPIAFTLPNCFRAASDVRYTMIVSILSMWIFRVGCSYVFALGFKLGVMGVWYAMAADWAVRAIFFAIHFIRGKWFEKYKPLRTET